MVDYDSKAIIELGKELKEFKISKLGRFLYDSLSIFKSEICVEMAVGRVQADRGSKKRGEWRCNTLEEFYLKRGEYLGIEKTIDLIESTIMAGIHEEELQQDEKKS